jgi:hypothetical protein
MITKSLDSSDLLEILEFITSNKLESIKPDEIENILASPPSNWLDGFRILLLDRYSESSGLERSLDELLEALVSPLDKSFIRQTIEKIESIYDSVKLWEQEEILEWAKNAKDKSWEEKIALCMRASQLDSGHKPRYTQIISLILLLNNIKGKGRLLQVSTGEGKSMITAMIASIKALSEEIVDVVTSSPILAVRDLESKQGYFDILGLTVSHNIGNSGNDKKECYESQIIYGDAAHFQGDILRHEFKGFDIRGDREFGTVIVDEVDSMLVDDASHMVKLSSAISGMEYLEPLLCSIWVLVANIAHKFQYVEDKKQLFYIDGKFEYNKENGVLTLQDGTREEDIIPVEDQVAFIKGIVENYIKDMLNDPKSLIPNHLRDYVEIQKSNWGESAANASILEENKHYVIKSDDKGNQVISPVNYSSTGIVQDKTQWGDGQHQFLQIKHGLKITGENLTSCFISNLAFFKRYGGNIFGMTGTLGSLDSRNLLSETYNIDYGFIPTYKPKRFIELPAKLANSNEEKIQKIIEEVRTECSNKGRAALIICETISEVEDLTLALGGSNLGLNIRQYSRNDLGNLDAAMGSLDVIIATNLAGRGTDLATTKELEANGGLHVILSYLPSNLRVEEQAFGRTARQGNAGTGRLIINSTTEIRRLGNVYPAFAPGHNIKQIKLHRDLAESDRLLKVRLENLNKVSTDDALFGEFAKLYIELKGPKRDKKDDREEIPQCKLDQLEEYWGIWLKANNPEKEEKEPVSSFIHGLRSEGIEFIAAGKLPDSLYKGVMLGLSMASKIDNKKNMSFQDQTFSHILSNPDSYGNMDPNNYFDTINLPDNKLYDGVARTFKINLYILESGKSYIAKLGADYLNVILAKDNSGYYYLYGNIDHYEQALANAPIDSSYYNRARADISGIRELYENFITGQALSKLNDKKSKLVSSYNDFASKMRSLFNNGFEIISNPAYLTNYILRFSGFENDEAIRLLEIAAKKDPYYTFPANYNIAYNYAKKGNKSQTIDYLNRARAQIEEYVIPYIQSMDIILKNKGQDCPLAVQIGVKIDLLNNTIKHIDEVISVINGAKDGQELEVRNVESIRRVFDYSISSENEVNELNQLGLHNWFSVELVDPPKAWGSGLFMAALGIAQIFIGVVLAAGSGGTMGVGMIIM